MVDLLAWNVLDHGQPRTNTFHHHEKLLRHNDEDNHDDP
ncbi:hypothetical protein J112_08440 [Mycobacterium tuberculosis str. Beijing/NITR203]|nr:hypothetical protein J112_08440 [Mycobacterium tuberculosis str. Beijing/NITR203]